MFIYPELGGADKVRFGLKGQARPKLVIKRAILYVSQLNGGIFMFVLHDHFILPRHGLFGLLAFLAVWAFFQRLLHYCFLTAE